jgi:hypothetical protein
MMTTTTIARAVGPATMTMMTTIVRAAAVPRKRKSTVRAAPSGTKTTPPVAALHATMSPRSAPSITTDDSSATGPHRF